MKRSVAARRLAAILAVLAVLAPATGRAVIGGAADEGPLSRGTVMVLSSRGGVCSAVVVAPDAVLTAAHCLSGGGEHRVHFRGLDGAPVLIGIAARAIHPGFDAGAIKGRRRSIDLALVRTAEPLPGRFGPVALSGAALEAGSSLRVAGFGEAREGDGRSTGTFRAANLTIVEPYGPSRVLVWATGDGAGGCQGDSGGPIAQGEAEVVAVTTWSTGPNTRGCGALTQGVLLGPQRAWIDRTLAAWGLSARWS